MKKTIIILLSIFITYYFLGKIIKEEKFIPNESIRMRIVPNSNSDYDQNIKKKVKTEVESVIFDNLKGTTDFDIARTKMKETVPIIDKRVNNLLRKENYNLGYKINYGMNYFPEKEFNGNVYKAGEYESLVVTLGKGEGDNFWCVLFPPLCLMEAEESENTEYSLWIEDVIGKYF